jgi:hypothetical protein
VSFRGVSVTHKSLVATWRENTDYKTGHRWSDDPEVKLVGIRGNKGYGCRLDYVAQGRGVCRSAVKFMVHLQVTLNALQLFAVRANINFTTTLPYEVSQSDVPSSWYAGSWKCLELCTVDSVLVVFAVTADVNTGTNCILVDFKLSPCSECCIHPFGWFPGLWILCADVSEHTIPSSWVM